MNRKKVLFVIVEGPSDDEALGPVLTSLYDKCEVYLHIMRKDITSENSATPNNIVSQIGNVVREHAKLSGYQKGDFEKVVHIVDMDGAYIPDDNVIEDLTAEKAVYSTDSIRTCKKENITRRNERKRANIDKLCAVNKIWGVPYEIYYMSCNLDHVLHNKQNSSNTEKERDAHQFAKKYRNDACGFVEFMTASDFSIMSGYKESWCYIKTDLRSLERHSNLGLCLEEAFALQKH